MNDENNGIDEFEDDAHYGLLNESRFQAMIYIATLERLQDRMDRYVNALIASSEGECDHFEGYVDDALKLIKMVDASAEEEIAKSAKEKIAGD